MSFNIQAIHSEAGYLTRKGHRLQGMAWQSGRWQAGRKVVGAVMAGVFGGVRLRILGEGEIIDNGTWL